MVWWSCSCTSSFLVGEHFVHFVPFSPCHIFLFMFLRAGKLLYYGSKSWPTFKNVSVVNINSNLENIWNCGKLKVESWIVHKISHLLVIVCMCLRDAYNNVYEPYRWTYFVLKSKVKNLWVQMNSAWCESRPKVCGSASSYYISHGRTVITIIWQGHQHEN